MAPRHNPNSQLPGSSSSISLNDTPTDEINYDSDISEDDHAIAEGGDDEEYDEEEEDEDDDDDDDDEGDGKGFAVDVNTLTGNKFSIMIHPSDTVEVLKTRIAFQEGISPADQNILLENSGGCNNDSATIQELNIDCNSKLTLVTNVASGVPFKTTALANGNNQGLGGSGTATDPLSFKLAPTIRRTYNNSNSKNTTNIQQQNTSSSSSSSIRLPKIPPKTTYLDKNSNVIISSTDGSVGSAMHRNELVATVDEGKSQHNSRLDEREWMKSLFNKVVQRSDEEVQVVAEHADNDIGNWSSSTNVISMDSTIGARTETAPLPPHISKRYVGTKYAEAHEDDGSILVVHGDDGVILIIQKNTGKLLEEACRDSNNNNGGDRYCNNKNKSNRFIDSEANDDGRIGRLGRYATMDSISNNATVSCSSYRRSRYQQDDSRAVQEKIKENAVTLEKMRQVRSRLAAKKRDTFAGRNWRADRVNKDEEGMGDKLPGKILEFPRIGDSSSGHGFEVGIRNGGGSAGYKGSKVACNVARRSAMGSRGKRSINSSKMSLNRLIAEIYLQSKRKGHAFQPGQPPYTEQQLLRYVQLKTTILLDEQKRNKTDPCSKCQLDDDWSFSEAAPYMVPTVVMNRYKRLTIGRHSKSLDKENVDLDDDDIKAPQIRRKSMIPVVVSSSAASQMLNQNGCRTLKGNRRVPDGRDGQTSAIPRLTLKNRDHDPRDYNQGGDYLIRTMRDGNTCPPDQGNELASVPDDDGSLCDTIVITCGNGHQMNGTDISRRPSLKVYAGTRRSTSSRPDWN